jgi:hypothetical protein
MSKKEMIKRAAVALVIAFLVPASASAQFGGVKKAADKVKKAATEKVTRPMQHCLRTLSTDCCQ